LRTWNGSATPSSMSSASPTGVSIAVGPDTGGSALAATRAAALSTLGASAHAAIASGKIKSGAKSDLDIAITTTTPERECL
jgi:hypothetical protein